MSMSFLYDTLAGVKGGLFELAFFLFFIVLRSREIEEGKVWVLYSLQVLIYIHKVGIWHDYLTLM